MPIIKSAIKRVRQQKKRTERRKPVKSHMKTMIKKVMETAKKGDKAGAEKLLPQAYKAVDMCLKRHMLHSKTAARRKSAMSKAVAAAGAK